LSQPLFFQTSRLGLPGLPLGVQNQFALTVCPLDPFAIHASFHDSLLGLTANKVPT
jgi:hypothetical protein